MIKELKGTMIQTEMTDKCVMKYFLDMQVKREHAKIFFHQEKYITKFRIVECKLVANPMSVNGKLSKNDNVVKVDETLHRNSVGSLIYLSGISCMLLVSFQGS